MGLYSAWRDRRFTSVGEESISQNPSEPLIAALGGTPSASGVAVTPAAAESLATVFACDLVIKRDVAQTPIKLKRVLEDGSREDARDHPVYALLHDRPNSAMSPPELKECLQGWLNLWGNTYAQIERDRRGVPTALWPLASDRMTVDLDGMNRLRYRYRLGDGRERVWIRDPAAPAILHIRQNTRDGIHGRSPLTVVREAFAVGIAEQQYRARWYGQGGHAQLGLTTDHGLTEEAAKRVRHDYEMLTQGQENWHRPVVMDHGLKPVQLSMPLRDAQFIENRRLSRSELASIFRVPAHKVNDLERATFSNIEHQAIEWITDGLMPHFTTWCGAIKRDLLTSSGSRALFPVFKVDALRRGDFKGFQDGLAVQRQNGVLNANEWRALADMDDRIPADQGGNDYLVNGNMTSLRRDPAAAMSFEGSVES